MRDSDKLSVKDWDHVGYALLVIYFILALLTSAAFFVALLYFSFVVLGAWSVCRPSRDGD